MTPLITWARQHPSGVLLAVQLISLLVYPFLDDTPPSRVLFGLTGVIVLVIAVFTVYRTPSLTWVSAVLGGPLLVLTVLEAIWPADPVITVSSAALHVAFYGYTTASLLRYMFHDDTVTTDEVYATGATFTVVAWGFAYLYQGVQVIWPGSFSAAVDSDQPRSWIELLFLSVTTLTSTGLSDIVPIEPHARSFVMIEQIAGMLYLALVVARISAITARRLRRGDHPVR